MPPKGGNAKKETGRAKKADNEAKKQQVASAVKESKEAADWSSGAKSNKKSDDKEAKKAAEAAKKAELARLLAEEEAAAPAKVKAAPKAGSKKPTPKPAGPGALAAGGGLSSVNLDGDGGKGKQAPEHGPEAESFAATGLDDALDLLTLVNAKTDKASVGQQAAGIEKHPERRFKAAYEAYKDREMPIARQEHPGLRLQQYNDLLFKQFQKSPDNPFNQVTASYDATKEEKSALLKKTKTDLEQRLRQ